MATFRGVLAAVLGLTLWVQGLAIAAAPVETGPEPASAMEMQMPCHGDSGTTACDCCDEGCPDMAACVIGHFAGAPPTSPDFAAVTHAAAISASWSPKTAVLPLPVRPPIFFHA